LAFYEGRIIADGEPTVVLADPEVRRYVTGEIPHLATGDQHAAH
jgi:ABC-type lipopolysaccharide export system ATPase subunit